MTEAAMRGRLEAAAWLRDERLQAVLAALDGAERRTRLVGGVVRDTLLGVPHKVKDFDIATEFTPEAVTARAGRHGIAAHPTGIEHGTVTLVHHGLVAEVTTLREDVETDGRRALVRFGTDWRRDAERRDFTLNALYANADGGLFDPLGGLADLMAGRVRFIGNATQRIEEDALRVYRFFRFSASHGHQRFDGEGLAACRAAAGRLDHLSAERVGSEMLRMLGLPAIAKTIEVMIEAGVLRDLPVDADARLGRLEVLAERSDVAQRLALLAGDGEGLERLKARWRLSNETVAAAGQILAVVQDAVAGDLGGVVLAHERQPARSALPVAVALGAVESGWLADTQAALDRLFDAAEANGFSIKAQDLVARGYQAGPALGKELARLRDLWARSGFALGREALLAQVENK